MDIPAASCRHSESWATVNLVTATLALRLPCGYWKRITFAANTTQTTCLKARQQVFLGDGEMLDEVGEVGFRTSRYLITPRFL